MKRLMWGGLVVVVGLCLGRGYAADLHWQGGTVGKETAWAEAGNWAEGKVPGVEDSVVFGAPAKSDCLIAADARVKNVTVAAEFAKAVSQAGPLTISGDCNIASGKGINNASNRVEIQGNIVSAQGGEWMKGLYGGGEIVHNIVDGKTKTLSGMFDGLTISGAADHVVNNHTMIQGPGLRGLVISDTKGCKLMTGGCWFTIVKNVTIGGQEGGELDMRGTVICMGPLTWIRGPKGVLTLDEQSSFMGRGSPLVPDEPWTRINLNYLGVLKLSGDLTSGSLVAIGDYYGEDGAVLDCQGHSFKAKEVILRGGNAIINGGVLTIGALSYEKTQNKKTKSTTGTIQGTSLTAQNVKVSDGTLVCKGPLIVTGTLDIGYGATLDLGANDLTVKGEMNVGGKVLCTGKITKPASDE